MRTASRNISHSKFKRKIKKLYNRGYISKENYEHLIFQYSLYIQVGESLEAWKYVNLEIHDRGQEINKKNAEAVLDDWLNKEVEII